MVSSGKKNYKYFIGSKDDDPKIKPLRIVLLKTSAYVKSYAGKTKWIYFFIEDDELLQRFNIIWNLVRNNIKKNLIENPSTRKFLITRKRSYHDVTDFHDKEVHKVDSNYICLAVIIFGSLIKKDDL